MMLLLLAALPLHCSGMERRTLRLHCTMLESSRSWCPKSAWQVEGVGGITAEAADVEGATKLLHPR